MPPGCPWRQEICAKLAHYLEPCACGGVFRKGSSPRCPSCEKPLSARVATDYIETMPQVRKKAGGARVTGTKPTASSLKREKYTTISGPSKSATGSTTMGRSDPETSRPLGYSHLWLRRWHRCLRFPRSTQPLLWQAQATSHAECRSARNQVSSELIPQ